MASKEFALSFIIVFICTVKSILPPSYRASAPFMAFVDIGENYFCGGVVLNER